MNAVGYIRRSNGGESVISRSTQEAAIQSAAAARGDHVGRLYVDWGRSGSDRSRPEFLAMVAAIESGEARAVYAYDADRLARREATLHLLLDAAEEAGIPVVDRQGRDLSGRDRVVAGVMGVIDSEVLRKMTVRARENARRRKLRGDDDGPAPYGHRREWTGERFAFVVDDPEAIARVVDPYRETRSLNEVARRLNLAGVKADRGGAWHACSVQRVIDRNAPELRAGAKGRGVRAASKPRALSRLLLCPCGQVMSPAAARRGTRWYCRQAVVGVHEGQRGISEAKLLPWVYGEASRLVTPAERVALVVAGDPERRAEVAKHDRAIAASRGVVGPAILAAMEAERDALTATPVTEDVELPEAIDWSWPVVELSAVLRAMWERVECELVDGHLTPVRAVWRKPEWRRP